MANKFWQPPSKMQLQKYLKSTHLQKKQNLTVNANRELSLRFINLMCSQEDLAVKMEVRFYNNGKIYLISDKIDLPVENKLPRTRDIYNMRAEKIPGERGYPIRFWLH